MTDSLEPSPTPCTARVSMGGRDMTGVWISCDMVNAIRKRKVHNGLNEQNVLKAKRKKRLNDTGFIPVFFPVSAQRSISTPDFQACVLRVKGKSIVVNKFRILSMSGFRWAAFLMPDFCDFFRRITISLVRHDRRSRRS